jgi:hypothetical protein
MHTTTPTDKELLAAFNGCEKVIDGLHAVLDLAAPSTYDQQAMDLCNVCGWKGIFPGEDCLVCKMAAPSTRHMEEQPDGTLIEVQPQAAPSTSLPFAPWSKEAEMMEAWAAPSASPLMNSEILQGCKEVWIADSVCFIEVFELGVKFAERRHNIKGGA